MARTPAVQSLLQRLENGGIFACEGVDPAAHPFFATLLRHVFPHRPVVVVTDGLKTQESIHQDITTWLNGAGARLPGQSPPPTGEPQPSTGSPLFYPAWEILPHDAKLPHADVISERLETLVALSHPASSQARHAPLVISSVAALLQRTFAPQMITERTRSLTRGDQVEPLDLVEWLEEQGYEPEAQVTHKGEMALRGGILDVYPLTCPWPARLEFFGNELESLRYFDPLTQISKEEIRGVTIPPAGELGILKRLYEAASPAPEPASDSTSATQLSTLNPQLPLATLIDYLPRETIFLLCEPRALDQHAEQYAQPIPREDPFFIDWDKFQAQIAAKAMTIVEVTESTGSWDAVSWERGGSTPLSLSEGAPREGFEAARRTIPSGAQPSHPMTLSFQSLDAFRPIVERALEPQIAEGQRREFFSQLHRWSRQDYSVHVFCNNEGERQRFGEIWREYGLNAGPTLELGALSRGFICHDAKVVIVTDAEIFGRYKVQRPRRLKSPHALAARSALDIDFTELEEGDYVVHLQHGIGRYLGLKTMPVASGRKDHSSGAEQSETGGTRLRPGPECLAIEYAGAEPGQPAPKLYVPVSEAHLVSKYVGAGKARPPLNTLGGARWAKTKAQAEIAVRDLAAELLSIQAARETQQGHVFPPDSTWQREFESSFVYEETPDQMRSILEAKADMESTKPMDRLICGDVGFGKTEVAIRAAFKAVMGGRQVAVLVPTTVLAQQHFNTFRERMADYPIRIELLSRFRTPRDQRRVVGQLALGGVDIVIGTHRLIQDDIVFKDLGLVVIDEEQRFGVLHKEKFKLLRKLVDVLTLSATPIPRTLYLALSGARDMSTIETPPQDRLPIETIVTQYDERVIRDAIQRELNREGQVFYLHNRVFDIDAVAQRLRGLVPHARIVVGHGQMNSDDLEQVMTQFVNGEADVLLSTTIIESGLDIPNANTIIIDRADRFGLSDLYQLRGRVGRYKHQAFAYLLLPRHAGLLADARKRISAIKQYSTLGSGFKIAMRDLEIRGAGNLLGSQQSGHITAVGFELYCQLLKQSVGALKGEKVKPRVEVQVRLDFIALDPSEENARSSNLKVRRATSAEVNISIPREVATYVESGEVAESQSPIAHRPSPIPQAAAYVPFDYIADSRQRIEIYRKLAQVTDRTGLDQLQQVLRDRFGPLPKAVEALLQLTELKVLASERNITALETKDDKLMLTRNNDWITLGGKFPRLTKTTAQAKLKEIKKFLLGL